MFENLIHCNLSAELVTTAHQMTVQPIDLLMRSGTGTREIILLQG